MILADSSAWIDFLRDATTPLAEAMVSALRQGLLTTDPVMLEVLAGAQSDRHEVVLRGFLARAHRRRAISQDYVAAARIARGCRQAGDPVRGHLDCLIAAIAIRLDVEVLARDRDYAAIARHTSLRLAPV